MQAIQSQLAKHEAQSKKKLLTAFSIHRYASG